jgi:hypothetical protein
VKGSVAPTRCSFWPKGLPVKGFMLPSATACGERVIEEGAQVRPLAGETLPATVCRPLHHGDDGL